MTNILLKYSGPLGLPNGIILNPGKPAKVEGWAKMEGHPVVKGWLSAGLLEVVDDDEDDGDDDGPVDPELEDLKAQAKELGIKVHYKWSKNKIQEAINAKLAE